MGRKQKLRQEKRNIKNKAAAAAAPEVTAAAADATTFSTEDAIAAAVCKKAEALKKTTAAAEVAAAADAATVSTEDTIAEAACKKAEALEEQLPKSDTYVQGFTNNITTREQFEFFQRGATEDACIHSMFRMGQMLTDAHLALPWFLEGAIRGSSKCTMILMLECYSLFKVPYREIKPYALQDYWGKINTYYTGASFVDDMKCLRGCVEQECAICSKTDTKTLTLQQCKGCSVYCYCSEGCQTIHWKEHKHRNECKQVQILNKYHKPYAKEIRDAVIRGDKEIPSLEKLRYKLGLTRPTEEYQEFFKRTYNGKEIDPDDYLVAREDGTVWVGSTPSSPIGTS
ncbi:hypothetical protein FRACYDRAFT_255634 [Fragilariopsis cylindrus CCMP1102]|uniref:MYND-type domain-containing protein n=1 Tax=Fragilariopsis cylindrus CCMP1102 TaxID=635003 RepID=A0A1E7EJU5_9STRA|nr:hypothetical protein FRACYDRAFT_255634 [Fragilariopsis cylindrus CCMP1102]|eukprot:OEU06199.1 hypothetical protein FRACYDRAFT_255634 [Fragilariopsis cylindrus CCMP1102]